MKTTALLAVAFFALAAGLAQPARAAGIASLQDWCFNVNGDVADLCNGGASPTLTGTVNGLGTVLVDGKGITVYMFATDVRGHPSRCYNICAVQWPPVVLPPGVSKPVAGAGIHPSLLGTAPRTDGSTQLTYNGWPLYLWQADSEPGQATGQGINSTGGLWYVLNPAGQVVTKSAT